MPNYFIIGGDGKQYGPVTADDLRQWIGEGRLDARSQVKAESDAEWRTLDGFPEFADLLGTPAAAPDNGDWRERDYELDIVGCISSGWELVKGNLGIFFVGVLVYFAIEMGIGMVSNIPIVGPMISLANFVISGPFMGGIFWMFLRGVRGEPAQVNDIFAGFKRSFGQLFLAVLVQGIFIGLCLLPFIIVLLLKIFGAGIHADKQLFQNDPAAAQQFIKTLTTILIATLPVLFVCAIPAMYLGTSWKFSLPLIMDKGMDFWTAMKTSFKMVNKHWWQVFGLILLISLLNLAGFIACCVGMLFTLPVGFAALMFAYETIFGRRKTD